MLKPVISVLFFSCLVAQAQQNPIEDTAKSSTPKAQEQIIVTGTYTPVPLEEMDRSVTSIGLGQSPSLYRNTMDALASDPSIDLRQRAPGIQGDLSIRGSSFGQTLVLLDGLRLNDEQAGHNNLDLPFPFIALDTIEVLKGSGSTLYGSDALGGAVNFRTGLPTRDEARFSIAGGNFETDQENSTLSLLQQHYSEQLTLTREHSTGFLADRDYRSLAIGSESILHSSLGTSHVLLGLSDRPFGAAQFYGNYPSWERTKGWFAGLTQDLGRNTSTALGYRRHTDLFDLIRNQPLVYENNHVTESWQAALRRQQKIESNTTLSYGTEGYRDSIDSSNLGRHRRDRGAFYGNIDARALRRFSFSAGAREEVFTGGNSQFSPAFSGGYWLGEHLKLRGSISSAFRLPTYTDLYYSDPANRGNPNLKPESAWNFEGGAQLAASRATLDLVIFHRREKNDIDYVRVTASSPWQAENINKLNFTGVEASLRLRIGQLQSLSLAYTGLHGAHEDLSGEQSKYTFEHPVHFGTAIWQGQLPQRIITRVRLNALERYQQDPYAVLEAAVERSFGHIKPFLQLTNVTNTGYEEISGVRMPGRGVLLGVELSFSK